MVKVILLQSPVPTYVVLDICLHISTVAVSGMDDMGHASLHLNTLTVSALIKFKDVRTG